MVLLASDPRCTWAVAAAAAAGVAIPAAEDQEALAADALRGWDDDRKNRWKWVEGGIVFDCRLVNKDTGYQVDKDEDHWTRGRMCNWVIMIWIIFINIGRQQKH